MRDLRYFRPGSREELLDRKRQLGSRGIPLAGGSNVMVYIKEGSIREGTLLDIHALAELRGVREADGVLEIGAAETMADLLGSRELQQKLPLMIETLSSFANPLVRNRATLGGNIADASPIGDTIPPLLCLQAELAVAGAGGERTVPLAEFFAGPGRNRLGEEEVILAVRVPLPSRGCGVFQKLGLRKGTSCSVTSLALWLDAQEGRISDIRIACGGAAPTPVRASTAEEAFRGQAPGPDQVPRLAEALMQDLSPITDVRGSADYRRLVSVQLLSRAVRRALGMEEASR